MNRQIKRVALVGSCPDRRCCIVVDDLLADLGGRRARRPQENVIKLVAEFPIKRGLILAADGETS